MNFENQIATMCGQSERLLALGVSSDTADMSHISESLLCFYDKDVSDLPSWSLSRLLEMMPKLIQIEVGDYYLLITPLWISYANIMHGEITDEIKAISITRYGMFDELIDMIDWLIQNGHFNKEYLNEKR